jgi:hypothetical protein
MSDYIARSIAKRVQSIPALSVPMTDDNEKIAPMPDGQKDLLCVMDYTGVDKSGVPDEFDGMTVWKEYLTPTVNQEECGSCWAFASSSCLADRFNVVTKQLIIPSVSTNFSLLCAFNESLVLEDVLKTQNYTTSQAVVEKLNRLNASQFQCGGNYLLSAWCALLANGTTSDECLPYKLINPFILQYELLDFGFNGRTAFLGTTASDKVKANNFFFLLDKNSATWSCSSIVGSNKEICWDHTIINNQRMAIPLKHYHCGLIYKITDDKDLDRAIRYDLVRYGPLSTVMNLFDSFYAFDPVNDGVYAPTEDPKESSGGHAVEIVGFGRYKDKDFWWIRNSWGADWGINGCFRMERRNKACDVENQIITGIPYFFWTPDQYDTFLTIFEKKNPVKVTRSYTRCLTNPWLKKYFAIYYAPVRIELYNDASFLTFFRVLAEHPGQKAVLYPQYGLTTKIMSVYPGILTKPSPDPDHVLKWFRRGCMASSHLSFSSQVFSISSIPLYMWIVACLVVVCVAVVVYRCVVIWKSRRRSLGPPLRHP